MHRLLSHLLRLFPDGGWGRALAVCSGGEGEAPLQVAQGPLGKGPVVGIGILPELVQRGARPLGRFAGGFEERFVKRGGRQVLQSSRLCGPLEAGQRAHRLRPFLPGEIHQLLFEADRVIHQQPRVGAHRFAPPFADAEKAERQLPHIPLRHSGHRHLRALRLRRGGQPRPKPETKDRQ